MNSRTELENDSDVEVEVTGLNARVGLFTNEGEMKMAAKKKAKKKATKKKATKKKAKKK